MLDEGFLRVLRHGLERGPLLAAFGHAHGDLRAPLPAQPALEGVEVGGHGVDEDLLRDRLGVEARVRLPEVVRGEFGGTVVVGAFDDPAALAADASAADVEDLDGGFELLGDEGEDVAVGGDREDDGGLVEDLLQGRELVAQTRRLLVVEFGRGLGHLLLPFADETPGAAGHEVDDAAGELPVVLDADAATHGAEHLSM